jgi:hypothetical protein
LRLLQVLFKLRQLAVLQLSDRIEIAFALEFFNLKFDLVDLFFELR